MKKSHFVIGLLLVGLTGCANFPNARAQLPLSETTSSKSARMVTECVTEKWAGDASNAPSKLDTNLIRDGYAITASLMGMGLFIVDVTDTGNTSKAIVYTTHPYWETDPDKKIMATIIYCQK